MYRHTSPIPSIMFWDSIGVDCHTSVVHIACTLNSQRYISEVLESVVLPYIQCLLSAILQQDYARSNGARYVQEFFFIHQTNCFLGLLFLRIYRQSKACVLCLHNHWPGIHQISFGKMWNPHGLLYPEDSSKISLILWRGVGQQLYPTMVAILITDFCYQPQEAVVLVVLATYQPNKFLCDISGRFWYCILCGQQRIMGTGEYFPPLQFTCRNCGGGDRGRVAIYRPFGEVSLSLNRTVTCMVLKANDRRTSCPCHDEFRGPRSDYVRQVALATKHNNNINK
ncbi:uncharacterized protein TNCV_208001 [Trichonephila clavipes]|uniref:Uncharacterized protein n=1 Tax=Trichonephila clavipes TaxID=2585209 RepID=A0A8X6VRW0_TRICX|nr:uncharacterized protein TNCV_208001 [Trichonephila clavipes]